MADAFYDPDAAYDARELAHELSHSGSDWSVMGDETTYEEGYEAEPRYRSVPPQADMAFPGTGCHDATPAATEFYDPDHDYGFRSVSAAFASKEAGLPLAVPSLQRSATCACAAPMLEHPIESALDITTKSTPPSPMPTRDDALRAPPLPAQPFALEPTHLACRADATPAEVRAALDACLLGGGAPRCVEGMSIEVDGLFNAAKFKYKCSISGDCAVGVAPRGAAGAVAGAPPVPSLGGALLAAPLSFVARVFRDGTRGSGECDGASAGGNLIVEFQRRRGSGLLFHRLFGALARSAALAPVLAAAPAATRAPVDGPTASAPAPALAPALASTPSSSDGFSPLCAMLRAGGECGVAAASLAAVAAAASPLAAREHAEHGVADALVARLHELCAECEHGAPAALGDAAAYACAVTAIAEGTKDIAASTSDRLAEQLRTLAAMAAASLGHGGGDGSCRWEALNERRAARQCERALKALGAH